MQRAVTDASGACEVDRACKLGDERQRFVDRRGCVMAQRDVERFSRDVLLGAIRHRPFNAGSNRFDYRRVEQSRLCRVRQLVGQRLGLFGRNVEAEHFDGDQTVARGFVRAENRAERANTDLMQDPKRAERWRWGEGRRLVFSQGPCS